MIEFFSDIWRLIYLPFKRIWLEYRISKIEREMKEIRKTKQEINDWLKQDWGR